MLVSTEKRPGSALTPRGQPQEVLAPVTAQDSNDAPLCACGCGQPTARIRKTINADDRIKGQFNRYVNRHHVWDQPLEQRFWAKVLKGDLCWTWLASIKTNGYGEFWDGSRVAMAHRVAYELVVGPIPAGLDLDHLCRNRACVRPSHLEPVTRSENLRRGIRPRKTHCRHGHVFDRENTSWERDGSQKCKACCRRRAMERYYRKRGREQP